MDDIDEITYCKNEDCKYCYCFDEQSNSTDMKWHYYVEYKPPTQKKEQKGLLRRIKNWILRWFK